MSQTTDKPATGNGSRILEPVAPDKQLTLKFDGISAYVSTQLRQPGIKDELRSMVSACLPPSDPEAAATKRQVLFNLSGEVLPGEVFSLMGPSGSGKTSLLSVIAGRAPKVMETKGTVRYNGMEIDKSVKKRIGFVLQDDVLFESLTVYETLYYAAILRLPSEMALEEKKERIGTVMAALGLEKCRDTIIGGFFRRGVSGGERKRVSIGHELLIDPSILMLDEPTSGLDSTTAMHLLVVLRQLASGGRAILTTIHQPSSRLYQQLDKLLLLADGHAMYYGLADKVVPWFHHLGFKLPYGVNTADFILDLATGEMVEGGQLSGKAAVTALWRTYEGFFKANPKGFRDESQLGVVQLLEGTVAADVEVVVEKEGGQQGRGARIKAGGASPTESEDDSSLGDAEGGKLALAGGPPVKEPRQGARYWDQVQLLLVRSVKVRRFESLSVQRFLQLAVVAVITGMFWFQKGGTSSVLAGNDTVGLLFFELLFPAFSTMFGALYTFPADYSMLLKERASGMYQLSAYYLARLASDLPMDCTYPSVFVIIVYWMGWLRPTAAAFLSNWAAVIVIVLIAQTWGLWIGAAFMNPKSGQTVCTVVMLTFMLVGGYYVRGIPVWIRWVKYLSFVYWGFNLLLKVEFKGRVVTDCSGVGGCRVRGVQEALNLPVDPNEPVWMELVVMFSMLVALRLAVYWALKEKTKSVGVVRKPGVLRRGATVFGRSLSRAATLGRS